MQNTISMNSKVLKLITSHEFTYSSNLNRYVKTIVKPRYILQLVVSGNRIEYTQRITKGRETSSVGGLDYKNFDEFQDAYMDIMLLFS
jgi:hypothetical protein